MMTKLLFETQQLKKEKKKSCITRLEKIIEGRPRNIFFIAYSDKEWFKHIIKFLLFCNRFKEYPWVE